MASYKVVAQIVDLDMPAVTTGPTGGYATLCDVITKPMANVVIMNDRPVEGVNITIYDASGDPCFRMLPRPDGGVPDGGAPPDAAPPAPDASEPDAAEPDAPVSEPDAA